MFAAFIATVLIGLGSINMAFEQGQDNPEAQSFFKSEGKVFQDDREYGVDNTGY